LQAELGEARAKAQRVAMDEVQFGHATKSSEASRRVECVEFVTNFFKGDFDRACLRLQGKDKAQFCAFFGEVPGAPLGAPEMFELLAKGRERIGAEDLVLGSAEEVRRAEEILMSAVQSLLVNCAHEALFRKTVTGGATKQKGGVGRRGTTNVVTI
jgi:hypothetical protein